MGQHQYEKLRTGIPVEATLDQFMRHTVKQISKATDYGYLSEDWKDLWSQLEKADEALTKGAVMDLSMAMIALGAATERLSNYPDKELKDLKDERIKRTSGLMARNKKKCLLKYKVLSYAAERWSNDDEETIRLSEMCQLVWADLLAEIESYEKAGETGYISMDILGNDASSLKVMIRNFAPDYAKKSGRPKIKDDKNQETRKINHIKRT